MTVSPGVVATVPWHRSLYGRIAFGYILLIAVVVAAQALFFLWLLGQGAWGPSGVTRGLSIQLAAVLAKNPSTDLAEHLRLARPGEHVFAIMRDGRVAGSRLPPKMTVQNAIEELKRSRSGLPMTWEASSYRAVGIVVGGETIGVLGIVPPTPVEKYGVTLALLGLVTLISGTLVSGLVIFGPVRRRIGALQAATQRFGHGDFSARAPAEGRDEVAALARSFNAMAAELAERDVALNASNLARQQLLADVSHELMTPLTGVLGHLETLTMPEVRLDDERRVRLVGVARREAQRLERLVGDLLETARFEAGGGDLDPETMPTSILFEQVLAHHELECRARHITMSSSVSPEATQFFGDPFRIEQALQNVTVNALRHTPDGGTVYLVASVREGYLAIEVTDSGEGMAPEHLPLIFDRFYKVAPAVRTASGGGTGLGLSIVKAIVLSHGGRVSASSTLGRGTTVRIELPDTARRRSTPAISV